MPISAWSGFDGRTTTTGTRRIPFPPQESSCVIVSRVDSAEENSSHSVPGSISTARARKRLPALEESTALHSRRRSPCGSATIFAESSCRVASSCMGAATRHQSRPSVRPLKFDVPACGWNLDSRYHLSSWRARHEQASSKNPQSCHVPRDISTPHPNPER